MLTHAIDEDLRSAFTYMVASLDAALAMHEAKVSAALELQQSLL